MCQAKRCERSGDSFGYNVKYDIIAIDGNCLQDRIIIFSMDAIYIEDGLCSVVEQLYPHKQVMPHLWHVRWYNRWIRIATNYEPEVVRIYYAMCADGYLSLCIAPEGDPALGDLATFLYYKTCEKARLVWSSQDDNGVEWRICTYDVLIVTEEQFRQALTDFVGAVDAWITEYRQEIDIAIEDDAYDASLTEALVGNFREEVSLVDNLSLSAILHLAINIPTYQRIYCWEEKNVRRLLDDVMHGGHTYRMGTIILHRHDGVFDIIDGQQRLVTLSLILRKLGCKVSPLLNVRFNSAEANRYVAYNRSIIDEYIDRNVIGSRRDLVRRLLDGLEFSVLFLNTDNIDLAYTFFSNENSRGKALSDFDLLKAHHLRYVIDDRQAEYLAKHWDDMLSQASEKYEANLSKPYYRSLGLYVFRLRKWMNHETWDDFAAYKIKNEYEAAPIVEEIPPFGEQFGFNESIQGGAHFFAFVKQFTGRFELFSQTHEYQAIHRVDGRTHWWFRDVIETFLFAYYLKFGMEYLSEALVGISKIVLQFRFEYARANYDRLLEQAGHSGILPIIERATSPTFVLAGLYQQVKALPGVQMNLKPIALELQRLVRTHLGGLVQERIMIDAFKHIL